MEFFEDSNLEPPADYEFEDENYPPIEEEIDYDYNEFYNSQMMAPFTLEEILHHCIEPTLSDGFRHVGKIIIWCIIFRILSQSCKTINLYENPDLFEIPIFQLPKLLNGWCMLYQPQ